MATHPELQRFIRYDLYNELRWALIAASEWQADVEQVARGNILTVNHFRVVAMDSTFVHVRSLYEFFIDYPGKQRRADTADAKRDFNITLNPTTHYSRWIYALNKRVFHLDIKRPKPFRNGAVIPGVKVNKEVVTLAQDVLDLWDNFTLQAPDYARLLCSRRSKAINEAGLAAISRGRTSPVFD